MAETTSAASSGTGDVIDGSPSLSVSAIVGAAIGGFLGFVIVVVFAVLCVAYWKGEVKRFGRAPIRMPKRDDFPKLPTRVDFYNCRPVTYLREVWYNLHHAGPRGLNTTNGDVPVVVRQMALAEVQQLPDVVTARELEITLPNSIVAMLIAEAPSCDIVTTTRSSIIRAGIVADSHNDNTGHGIGTLIIGSGFEVHASPSPVQQDAFPSLNSETSYLPDTTQSSLAFGQQSVAAGGDAAGSGDHSVNPTPSRSRMSSTTTASVKRLPRRTVRRPSSQPESLASRDDTSAQSRARSATPGLPASWGGDASERRQRRSASAMSSYDSSPQSRPSSTMSGVRATRNSGTAGLSQSHSKAPAVKSHGELQDQTGGNALVRRHPRKTSPATSTTGLLPEEPRGDAVVRRQPRETTPALKSHGLLQDEPIDTGLEYLRQKHADADMHQAAWSESTAHDRQARAGSTRGPPAGPITPDDERGRALFTQSPLASQFAGGDGMSSGRRSANLVPKTKLPPLTPTPRTQSDTGHAPRRHRKTAVAAVTSGFSVPAAAAAAAADQSPGATPNANRFHGNASATGNVESPGYMSAPRPLAFSTPQPH